MTVGRLALDRPFVIEPDGREGLQLSAALWACAAVVALVGPGMARSAGAVGAVVDILPIVISGMVIAFGLHLVLCWAAGRPRWLAYAALGAAIGVAAALQVAAVIGLGRIVHDAGSVRALAFVSLGLCLGNLALLWTAAAHRAQQAQALNAMRAKADRLASELDALRLKLSPHFMFNSLSASVALLQSGRVDEGVAMLYRLSAVLRTSFDDGDEDLTLDEQISLVRDYLGVERARFPKQMTFDIDMAPSAGEVLIPSFLLQPLVENAVKYGVSASAEPVRIRVSASCQSGALHIVIENAGGAPARSIAAGAGVGHSATRSRLAIKYGGRATFRAGPTSTGYRCEICIPLAIVATQPLETV